MDKSVVAKVFGEVEYLANNIIRTAKGELIKISKAIWLNDNIFVIKHRLHGFS